MEKHRAIPPGYMTVGQIAKKMGVTVRALQYYDKEGVLSPSATSEGGRRLYTDKDMVKLHQILSMKYLGFSLEDIKNRLISLDTPADVADALTEHAAVIKHKMESLSRTLQAIEALRAEVLQMQSVDFGKYADIIANLKIENEMYWVIKHCDDDLLEHFRRRFDMDSARAMMERFKGLQNEAMRLQERGVPPESDQGQEFAQAFWGMIMEFTGGDMSMLQKLTELGDKMDAWPMDGFLQSSLRTYFTKLGSNPFEKEETN